MTPLQQLVAGLRGRGARRAVGLRGRYGARWWSYGSLYAEAVHVARGLEGRGIGAGDRVLLWAANSPEWAAVALGAILRGAVLIPIDEESTPRLVEDTIAALTPALLVIGDHGVAGDRCVAATAIPCLALADLAAGPHTDISADAVAAPIGSDAPAVILHTSGTTGRTSVELSHRHLEVQIQAFAGWRRAVRLIPARELCLSPLSHVQGLLFGMLVPLSIGLTVLYSTRVDPPHVIRAIRAHRIILLLAPPRVQHLLAEAMRALPSGRNRQPVGLRTAASPHFLYRRHHLFLATRAALGLQFLAVMAGGARLHPDDERFWFECGLYVVQGYGLTEAGGLVTVNVNGPFFTTPGSIGRPLGHSEIRLADDGEVLVRGPAVALTSGPGGGLAGANEFLATGDLARRGKGNHFYFMGRKKETIVTSDAHNASPDTIEAVLRDDPGVSDAVAIGMASDSGDEVHAVLLLDGDRSAGDVVARANAALEAHERIRSWTVWSGGDFPRTALLKPDRVRIADHARHLREQRGSTTSQPERPVTLDRVRAATERLERLDLVARYVLEHGGQPAEDTVRLGADLGFSSLDLIELASLIEQRRRLPAADWTIATDTSLATLRDWSDAHGQPHARLPPAPAPTWSDGPLVRAAGSLITSVVAPAWLGARAGLTVTGAAHLTALTPPFLIAALHHEHAIDVFAVYCALPARLRRRLAFVGSEWVFRDYREPSASTSRPWRLFVGAAFHLAVPLLFPFATVAATSSGAAGLMRTCRLIERGYCPLVFAEGERRGPGPRIQPGIGVIAADSRVPVLPLSIEGNDGIDFRPRRTRAQVTIRFGQPVAASLDLGPEDIVRRVEANAFASGLC